MKKFILPAVFVVVNIVFSGYSYGVDLSGPRSPAPYGVFSTISANSPEQGHAAVSVLAEKSGEPDFYRFSTQLATGITDNVEFGMNIPYVDNEHEGIEDIVLSVKHRLFDGNGYGPSAAYLLTISFGSGMDVSGTNGRIGAGIITGKKVGPFKGHINLIYSIPRDNDCENELRFSTGLEFSAAHNLEVLAEVYGKQSHYSDEVDELEARFGYRIKYGKGIYTTMGAGFGLANKMPDYRVFLSVTLSFQKRKPEVEKTFEEGG